MNRILLIHTLAYAAGIISGHFLQIPPVLPLIAALPLFLFAILMLLKRGIFYYLVFFSFLVGMGWGQAADQSIAFFPAAPEKDITIYGMVDSRPAVSGEGQSFLLKVLRLNGEPYSGGGLVQVLAGGKPHLCYGDLVEVKGKVLQDLTASNPHQFDYAAYLKRQGISATVGTLYGGEIKAVGVNRGRFFFRLVFCLRDRMDQAEALLPLRQHSFIDGMLFGDKGTLSFRERNVLSQTGLMDAFAVSGMHMGFVVLLAGSLARLIRLGSWGRFSFVSAFVFFYAAVTGFTPSVLRSGLMAVTGLAAFTIGSRKDLPTAFAAAALVILIKSPQALFDAGFQLSFAAAGGVLFLTPVFTQWLPSADRLPLGGWWREGVGAVLAAQVSLTPLIAYYFNVLSGAGLIIAPLAAWPVGFVIFLGLLAMILCPFSLTLASLPLYGAGLITEIIWQGADFISRIPGSHFILSTPAVFFLVVYYGFLSLLTFFQRLKDSRVLSPGLVVLLFIYLLVPVQSDHQLTVTFLDVGQGDSIYIQSPAGSRVLIDGGGSPFAVSSDPGERIVVPFLKSAGISRLDLVINTHPHDDHLQGLKAVLQEMKVGGLVMGENFAGHPQSKELMALAVRHQVPLYLVSAGQTIPLGENAGITVLFPDDNKQPENGMENNGSLVLRLTYGSVSFLFTGDAEGEVLQALVNKGEDLRADVLKLPHHGSRNGLLPSFYEDVSPSVVVIPVGRNSFGHPSPEVTAYWKERKIPLYRTDRDGAVTIKTDGKRISVQKIRNDPYLDIGP